MAEENRNSLFRKKSIEYIDSPEKLDRYLHVTNPGVWAVLLAAVVILAGVIVWSVFGRIEAHANVAIVAENGESICYVPEDALNSVVQNPVAEMEQEEIALAPDALKPMTVTEDMNVYVLLAGKFSVGDIVYEIPVETKLEDGVYSGTVTTEDIAPMSLLLN